MKGGPTSWFDRFHPPAGAFKPGLYTCQVNIIDAAAGKFVFPRLAMLVR